MAPQPSPFKRITDNERKGEATCSRGRCENRVISTQTPRFPARSARKALPLEADRPLKP